MNARDHARLRAAIERLEGKDRLLLLLHRIEGLESGEIASVLGWQADETTARLEAVERRLCQLISETGAADRG